MVKKGKELHKHAHLMFKTLEGDTLWYVVARRFNSTVGFSSTLVRSVSFVDTRRFGRWEIVDSPDKWGSDRGPDALLVGPRFVVLRRSIFSDLLCFV
jgi:hypothetical protein